jgi:hypothetical protein
MMFMARLICALLRGRSSEYGRGVAGDIMDLGEFSNLGHVVRLRDGPVVRLRVQKVGDKPLDIHALFGPKTGG